MFNIATLMQNLVAKKFQDKLGGIQDGMDMGASLLDDPSQIGGMIKDRIMNSPVVAAGRMTPEEYEESNAQSGARSRHAADAAANLSWSTHEHPTFRRQST